MQPAIANEIEGLRSATTRELRVRYEELFGESSPPSSNRTHLFRRVAWLQARALGELSERARQRAWELADDADLRWRAPRHFPPTGERNPQRRDPRLPAPGAALTRVYRERFIEVKVLESGFEYDGRIYRSLSAIALAATGTRWNGFCFSASRGRNGMTESKRSLRCAIYTRKSTEEGLEQSLNTLEAQRESAEAYMASQRQSGWAVDAERFDDGGCSGASLERPALQRLLARIDAGGVDCVVVYKVDRLSRSLLDFARLMAVFERRRVSFVSVTQEFNTTTSLGRLTLNILLSFAQFEREIIEERTRDKLGAARRKGKWIGGIPVLGYDVAPEGGRLVVNEAEAERVRQIYAIAARTRTLAEALGQVHRSELTTKEWTSSAGKVHRAAAFTPSGLRRLLSNILYIGSVRHKGNVYPGEQAAIVGPELWEQVNRKLTLNGRRQCGRAYRKDAARLRGCLYCGACGVPMKYTSTRQRRYRYYVCACGARVSAVELETALKRHLETTPGTVARVAYDVRARHVAVELGDGSRFEFGLPARGGTDVARGRTPRITRLMALALKLEGVMREGKVRGYAGIARAGQVSRARMSQVMSLLNLAPAIQEGCCFCRKRRRDTTASRNEAYESWRARSIGNGSRQNSRNAWRGEMKRGRGGHVRRRKMRSEMSSQSR